MASNARPGENARHRRRRACQHSEEDVLAGHEADRARVQRGSGAPLPDGQLDGRRRNLVAGQRASGALGRSGAGGLRRCDARRTCRRCRRCRCWPRWAIATNSACSSRYRMQSRYSRPAACTPAYLKSRAEPTLAPSMVRCHKSSQFFSQHSRWRPKCSIRIPSPDMIACRFYRHSRRMDRTWSMTRISSSRSPRRSRSCRHSDRIRRNWSWPRSPGRLGWTTRPPSGC